MDEFMYDYNLELVTYLLNKHIELITGRNPELEEEKEVKETEARSFFNEIGF